MSRPVIFLELDNFGSRKDPREIKHVFIVGPPEGVYGLGVIPHHHNIVVANGEPFHDISLDSVCVLVFVNHDIAVLLAQALTNLFIFGQNLPEREDQIIIVHELIGSLILTVKLHKPFYLGNVFQELRILLLHQEFDGLLKVCCLA